MGSPRAVHVDSFPRLKEISKNLAGAERYYLDTEFERTRTTRKLCLIQVSRGEEVYLVDTIRLNALEPLAEAIVRPDVEWVLHDGGQDLEWLREAMPIPKTPAIFDTQVAWGLIGPEYPVSLAYLLYRILGLRNAKEHQAGDWMERPLSKAQLDYAAKDVAHLPAIREWTLERIRKAGREALIHEICAETTAPAPPAAVSFDDYRNAWQLDAEGQAALRFLIDWYNTLPTTEKIHPRTLFDIARALPESGAELARIKGVHVGFARRHGDKLAGKLMRITAEVSKEGFQPMEPPCYATFERILAEGWLHKTVAEISAEIGMAPELTIPARVAKNMVKIILEKGDKAAAAEELSGWRSTALKERYLARCGG